MYVIFPLKNQSGKNRLLFSQWVAVSDCLFGSLLNNWLQIDIPAHYSVLVNLSWFDLDSFRMCAGTAPGLFWGVSIDFIAKTLFFLLWCSMCIYYQVALGKIGWRVLKQKAGCGELHGRLKPLYDYFSMASLALDQTTHRTNEWETIVHTGENRAVTPELLL